MNLIGIMPTFLTLSLSSLTSLAMMLRISIGFILSFAAPLLWDLALIFGYFPVQLLFLEKSFAFACLLYPLFVASSYFFRFFFPGSREYILNQECLELGLYIILLLDTFVKTSRGRSVVASSR